MSLTKNRKPINRISAKKLVALGGKTPFSTIIPKQSLGDSFRAAPKKKIPAYSSIPEKTFKEKLEAVRKLKAGNPAKKSRRRQKNQDYYKSSEWRAKRKAVFERDGYRCVEMIPYLVPNDFGYLVGQPLRCPNFGMNINGRQTGKGLVCEEKSYGHRGIEGRIDTCVTRCRDCDRRLTPLERPNHVGGFRR